LGKDEGGREGRVGLSVRSGVKVDKILLCTVTKGVSPDTLQKKERAMCTRRQGLIAGLFLKVYHQHPRGLVAAQKAV